MAAAMLKMAIVAACIALALLSMGPPAAMADIQDDCRATCRGLCDGFGTNTCNNIIAIAPAVLNNINFFFTTCKVRVTGLCASFCVTTCSLNTVTPASPRPPPCKP
uniref:Bifunctional inhibitor/plant lipid transfer protein/seed storage helical domain-containing protein n=1 Tax=Setaria viridis TaxID=4556 RepID=A0A4U6TMH6_SETVI|nr:hypothetical protein SEVIR_8G230112v2 [Setaria viridis]